MKNNLLHEAMERDGARKRGRIWKRIVSTMAVVVVFCTVYALVLPAVTLNDDPICGLGIHEHTDACYRTQIMNMTCAASDHVHDGCEDSSGNFACGFGQAILHSHGNSCYDDQENLICQLPERTEHVHAEKCMEYTNVLTCLHEEMESHAHAEDCYTETQNLTCTVEETPEHTHSQACYTTELSLTCEKPEVAGHSHTESCYEMQGTVICELEQVAVHTHTPSCCDEEGKLICGVTSGVAHVHDESCFTAVELEEPELICPVEAHVHVDTCYLTEDDLPAQKEEFLCDLGAHTHGEACYGEADALICTIPEHTHDASCKIVGYDSAADVEDASVWEETVADVELSGNWPEDILAIAESQLGYQESKKNVFLLEDGSVKGYTRYGARYDAPYIDWSAAFVSFCIEYAGAEGVPQDSGCDSYISKLEQAKLYRQAAGYTPKPGDLIFFDWEKQEGQVLNADHVGIVAEVILDENGEPVTVKTVEGDSSEQVQCVTYEISDPVILGYGEVPYGQLKNYVCGFEAHAHSEDCFDDQGNLTCTATEHEHIVSCYEWRVFYTDDTMYVQAVITGVETLPEDLSLVVKWVTAANSPADYIPMSAALSEQMENTPYFVGDANFYQMQLLSDGLIYELSADASVSVDVRFTKPVFSVEAVEDAAGMHTYMLTSDEAVVTAPFKVRDDAINAFSVDGAVQTEGAEPVEDTELIEEIPLIKDTYQAEAPDGESYENAEEGITGIHFETNSLSNFAVMLASTTQTGQYWTRVTNTSELAGGGTFMIVSAEGNYALRGDNANNYTPVEVEAVKGNTQYYTIEANSGTIDNNLYWTFSGSGSRYTVRNQRTSNYVSLTRVRTGGSILRPTYTEYVINATSATLTLTYYTPENCWRFVNGSYALRNSGAGAFGLTSSNDGSYNSSTYYYTRDMMIFKLSDVTELEIPEDVVENGSIVKPPETAPDKPNYGEFIVPSDSKTGDTAVVNPQDGSVSVSGKYYSDTSTSNLEINFRKDTVEENKINDGRVMTDKSVIYGHDDYGAFSDYAANTFSVTLSALGQEYEIPYQYSVRTPVDVVFVLDASGSMTVNDTDDGKDASRADAMVSATNDAIKHIMDDHEANRVGVVLYSGGAWEMLPLGRYTANKDEYLVAKYSEVYHRPSGHTIESKLVLGSSSLRDENGKSYANAGSDAVQGLGTYTQAGIAMGSKVFNDIGDDTTYTTTVGTDDHLRNYTVNRQPVFILLSDGEPTYSTNIYNDVLNGPHYGDGNGGTDNATGIHGYNTILSANYYKRIVGIQYDNPALFYTIGMGINTPEQGDGPQVNGSSNGDAFKRAILNPQPEDIKNLTSVWNPGRTVQELRGLLNGTYTQQALSTRSDWPEVWIGIPHVYTPIVHENPYADDYSYADDAFFGNLTSEDLKEIFNQIIESSMKLSPYGFILYKNSSVDIVDKIGEGMEIKGTPVLRYSGVNYTNPTVSVRGNVTTYTYNQTYIDPYIPNRVCKLSEIAITVTTDAKGDQTVEMYIPDTAVPTYTPELVGGEFYYESLPVRLIYQVGLTEEAEQDVLALQENGGSLTYYTNKWENASDITISTLLPSTVNPYYYSEDGDVSHAPYHAHQDPKTDNATQTLDYHVDCFRTIEFDQNDVLIQVVHKQGNNGKLVFEAEKPKDVDIPVEKIWDSSVPEEKMLPISVTLYSYAEETGESTPIKTIELNKDSDWKGLFEKVLPPEDGTYYYVREDTLGYTVSYNSPMKVAIENIPITVGRVEFGEDGKPVQLTITNSVLYELPSTGGMGIIPYTMGGILLIAVAAFILLYKPNPKRRKGDGCSS